ncbi:MAG: RNA methyltransferase [candidate division Zixibacteria bacterium]|nr:RNA methyltransferase [candidate division Zixibacteria bacterium]
MQTVLKSDWEVVKFIVRASQTELIEKYNIPMRLAAKATSAKFDKIASTKSPQGIIAVVKQKDVKRGLQGLIARAQRAVAANNVSDPGNLGTIIRTAAAFDYDIVVCVGDCADIYNPKTVRATQGGLFTIPVLELETPAKFIKLFGNQFSIATFSGSAKKWLSKATRIKKPVLVLGGEISGIDPQIEKAADYRFRIEQSDNVESLNVSVAAGVAMYKFYKGYWK